MKLISTLFFLIISFFGFSQSNTIIFGFSPDYRYDFNYTDGTYDSIALPSSIITTNELATFDPYRRIMYYFRNNSIYSYDLHNNSINILENTGFNSFLDMKYDMFNHCLFLRRPDSLYKYDFSTDFFSVQCDIPDHYPLIYNSHPSSYNPITHVYSFLGMLSPEYNSEMNFYIQVNIKTGEVIDTVAPLVYPTYGWHHLGHFWQYSFEDNELYVTHEEMPYSDLHHLSILDLSDGTFQNIMPLPTDYAGILNMQLCTFDQENKIYLLPYYTANSTNRLIVADLNNLTLNTFPFLFQTDLHHADYNPSPVLIFENDTLMANYFTNYTWYHNDEIIENENQQIHIPESNGSYYYSTIDSEGNVKYSNEILIESLGISQPDQIVSIYPNITNGAFKINLFTESKKAGTYLYYIHNIIGEQLLLGEIKNGILNEVDISNQTSGMYLISIYRNGQIIYSSKIIKN